MPCHAMPCVVQLRNNWATCNEGPCPRPWPGPTPCPYMGMAHSSTRTVICAALYLRSAMESSSLSDSGSDSVDEMATSSEGDASSQSLMSSAISDGSSSEEISSSSETDSQCSKTNNCVVIHPSVEQPLFPGSYISVFQSHLLLYQFHLEYDLTNEG